MPQKCRFCKSRSIVIAFKKNHRSSCPDVSLFACTNCGFGQHGTILRCQNCGLYYVDEHISQRLISTYYEVAGDPLYFQEQPARRKTFARYLSKLNQTYRKKGRLLDVGTNTGLFVKLAREQGWEAEGVEPNRWAVEYAKKNYNVKIIPKPFLDGLFPEGHFEVLAMWDVIEHFTDPIAEIKKVYRYLKPGGVFAFSTVDPDSILAQAMGTKWPWYMEMHKVFFSKNAAQLYLHNLGFNRIEFHAHWRYLSLGYLASRLTALNARMANVGAEAIKLVGASKLIVPYYANDLYDCYAFK